VREAIGIHDDEDVIRARNATLRERPTDVRKFFQGQFRTIVPPQAVGRATAAPPLRTAPGDDPYGF
jgi:hypothetical protein